VAAAGGVRCGGMIGMTAQRGEREMELFRLSSQKVKASAGLPVHLGGETMGGQIPTAVGNRSFHGLKWWHVVGTLASGPTRFRYF
jgi:hypothetical protein